MIITICILSSAIVTIFAFCAFISRRISGLLNSYNQCVFIYDKIDKTYTEFREFIQVCPKIYTENDLTKANAYLASRIKLYEDSILHFENQRSKYIDSTNELLAELDQHKQKIQEKLGSYEDLHMQIIDLRDDTIERLRRTDTKLDTLLSIIRVDIKK